MSSPVKNPIATVPTDSDLAPLPDIRPGIYRHYKGGRYSVQGVVRHSEDLAPLVLYRALYGAYGLWVRPHAMFCETVVVDGQTVPRFAWVSDAPTEQEV